MTGTRLILAGYVLDQNCQPVPNAWLDFWQADANGNYDNSGYTLRGHQFTDGQGRYFLETVAPGLYPGRPIVHLHAKVQPPDGQLMTTQIYFPDQSIQEQTATLEERDGYLVAYLNFVVQRLECKISRFCFVEPAVELQAQRNFTEPTPHIIPLQFHNGQFPLPATRP